MNGSGTSTWWFDSHCHLQDTYRPDRSVEGGKADLRGVLARGSANGVTRMTCAGTDVPTSREAVELAADPGGVAASLGVELYATIGLHPHQASEGTGEIAALLGELLRAHPGKVVAVGECGLDYHYDHSPRPAQRVAFAEQVHLAQQQGLALVVHTREAWADTFAVLESEGVPERTIFHSFTGGIDEARRCLELGAYLSFSGIVTFKSAADVRDAASICPPDRLLVETDSPVPHRGKTNEPALVSVVGEAVAALKGKPSEVLAAETSAATAAAFALA
jgi:TatD DNase family protein